MSELRPLPALPSLDLPPLPPRPPTVTKKEAEAELAALRARVPEAKNAYEPSGVVPPLAWVLMVPGALGGAVLGLAAGALVLAGGALAFLLSSAFLAFTLRAHVIFLVAALFAGGAALVTGGITIFGPPFTAGMVAGWAVWRAASAGKARGVGPPTVFACFSGLVPFAALFVLGRWSALRWAAPGSPAARLFMGGEASVLSGWAWAILVIGALIVLFGAVVGVHAAFDEERFCEPCGRRMAKLARDLALDAFLSLPVRPPAAVGAAAAEAGPLTDLAGQAKLFTCAQCGCGFLDLSLKAKVTYTGKAGQEPPTVDATWRCHSQKVTVLHAREVRGALEEAR